MVSKGKKLGPRPALTKFGLPRRPPGRQTPRDSQRLERLVLRAHPNLMSLLSMRASERGISRSALIEKLLVGFLKLDPRNPVMDSVGKVDRTKPIPTVAREQQPGRAAERWGRFVQASELLLNERPDPDWYDDLDSWWIDASAAAQMDAEHEAASDPSPDDIAYDASQRAAMRRLVESSRKKREAGAAKKPKR